MTFNLNCKLFSPTLILGIRKEKLVSYATAGSYSFLIFYYQSFFIKPSFNAETLAALGSGENCTEVNLKGYSPFWNEGIPAVMIITATTFFHNPYH